MNTWDEFIDGLKWWGGQGCSVTSWVRSKAHNAKVGGVPNSKHVTGQAIDVVWDIAPPPLEKLKPYLLDMEVKLVREKDHDHFEVL